MIKIGLYFSPPQGYPSPMSNVLKLSEFVEGTGIDLSPEANALIDYTLRTPRRQKFSRESIAEHFNETFLLIGGVPRLSLWADQNPGQFYTLFSKLLPSAIKADMNVTSSPIESMTVEQIRDLPTEQFKLLVLARAAESADQVEVMSEPEKVSKSG
jgi:hypothetical protein